MSVLHIMFKHKHDLGLSNNNVLVITSAQICICDIFVVQI